MAKVECSIEETPAGLEAMCGDCNHVVELLKAKDTPENRAALMYKLRRNCPHRAENHYVPVED